MMRPAAPGMASPIRSLLSRLGLAVSVGVGAISACSDLETDPTSPAERALSGLAQGLAPQIDDGALASEALLDAFREAATEGVSVVSIADANASVIALRVDLEVMEPVLLGGEAYGVTAAGALAEVQAVVGSGFVAEVSSLDPVGLLQLEGRTLSPVQPHGYTRILGVRRQGLGVVGHRDYHRGMYDSALQAGPGIVEAGLLDISERDLKRPRYLRAFVATCGPVAVVGATQRPMHLFTLGQRLLAWFAEAGLSCDEVVNLAGDREAVLALASDDRSRFAYVGHPLTAKASLLGFRRRQ